MLPEGKAVYQTKLQRRTLTPAFGEVFQLELSPLMTSHQLHFGVYDFDRYSRHDLIGAAVLQSLSPGGDTESLYELDLRVEKQVSLPNYQISPVCFLVTGTHIVSFCIKKLHLVIMSFFFISVR